MNDLVTHGLSVLMGFFAIMNPIATTPVFIGVTGQDDEQMRKTIAAKSLLLAFMIVVSFCLAGQFVFTLFGITLPAFRITGGFLVFLIGFQMLQGEGSPVQTLKGDAENVSRDAALCVAVSPLAMPILAGPGTITTAMGFVADEGPMVFGITIIAFGLLCVVTYICFISGERLVRFMGEEAMRVITRMMGLITAIIGTQMVIDGIRGAINLGS